MSRNTNRFVEQSDNKFIQMARDFVEVCPKCSSINISVRQRKTPKYFCRDCKNEFDDPKAKIVEKTFKQQKDFGKYYFNPHK